jgi:hypothetical protein
MDDGFPDGWTACVSSETQSTPGIAEAIGLTIKYASDY